MSPAPALEAFERNGFQGGLQWYRCATSAERIGIVGPLSNAATWQSVPELRDASGATIHAAGSSSHLWLDKESRKPVRADEEVMKAFAPWIATGS